MDTAMNRRRFDAAFVVQVIGITAFAYFFFGFMLLPCLNTLTLSLIHICCPTTTCSTTWLTG